jgi:hypothetical protein
MELQQIHSRDFVEVSVDLTNHWLYAEWNSYQSDASVNEGCELILDALQRYQLTKVLNDNRRVLGIWTGVAEWLAYDWFPRMRTAGMQKFALIQSPARFSQLSANTAMCLFDPEGCDVAGFHSVGAAMTWLVAADLALDLSGNESRWTG